MIGERPYASRDRSANFWPLAILSFGESWHNSHHADPTCARHGVDRGQLDISAWLIRRFEQAGWAHDVRWPKRDRFDKLAARRAAEKAVKPAETRQVTASRTANRDSRQLSLDNTSSRVIRAEWTSA